ncbi:hypothetical protein [Candidatus Gromoviella agglomerans]|uniref:hypothetical protein n=1 Tax=Candidatus Gromoviella agglomerans TaxID=2806609 RepID=UPI001E3C023D|nr:hypothetical protein [Candidatus Gromoviella agglomerans]UFX98159.1 hypothetical protein Gromo_00039 [Candidatus Gromoviella agglomerans]
MKSLKIILTACTLVFFTNSITNCKTEKLDFEVREAHDPLDYNHDRSDRYKKIDRDWGGLLGGSYILSPHSGEQLTEKSFQFLFGFFYKRNMYISCLAGLTHSTVSDMSEMMRTLSNFQISIEAHVGFCITDYFAVNGLVGMCFDRISFEKVMSNVNSFELGAEMLFSFWIVQTSLGILTKIPFNASIKEDEQPEIKKDKPFDWVFRISFMIVL